VRNQALASLSVLDDAIWRHRGDCETTELCHTENPHSDYLQDSATLSAIDFPERSDHVQPDIPSTALARCLLAIVGATGFALPAFAHLGGDDSSVQADRQVFHAQLRSTAMPLYQQHEMRTESGALLHEYQTLAGTIFAVTWNGALPPDLHQLFGNYFQRYQSAAPASGRPGMHRELTISTPDLVVQSISRMRAYQGMAYVPSLVPAGVSVTGLP